ncbi:protein kinase [Nonomuraea sp. NPDC059194]|uniref:serine/threonine-protein kinase n=1 Tax=Nonomuraea sp. NPDC059194 TaxID=3346764 RepID=UPI00368F327C
MLLDEIGAGGMGTVWRARSRDTSETVAVKLLRDGLAGDQDLVLRFVQERNVMRSLRHPNIVTVRDFVIEGERLALVMDLVEGGDLRTLLQSRGTLPQAEAAQLMAQVADALAAAHALGVVHRDIKPGNVLIDAATGQVRLTDFGVARIVHGPGLTQTTSIIGTPTYLAPEVADGGAPTLAVDVYALGLILYELVAGRPPFVGEHPMALLRQHVGAAPRRLPGMADALWAVLSACVAKNPAERPHAAEVATALRTAAPALAGLSALPPVARTDAPSATSEPLPPAPAPAPGPGPGPAPGPAPVSAPRGGAAPRGGTAPQEVDGVPLLGDATIASAGRRSSSRRWVVIATAAAALVASGAAVVVVAPWRAQDAEVGVQAADTRQESAAKQQEPAAQPVDGEAATPPVPSVPPVSSDSPTGKAGKDKSRPVETSKGQPAQGPQEEAVSPQPSTETSKQPTPETSKRPPKKTEPKQSTLVEGDPVGEDGPSDAPSKNSTPDWRCRDWIAAGAGVEMSPCMAVAGDTIYMKGRIRGSVTSDIHLQLYNTDTDTNVSQPFICSGVSPLGGIVKCGPFTTSAVRTGAKLDARQRWRRSGTSAFGGGAESPWFRW